MEHMETAEPDSGQVDVTFEGDQSGDGQAVSDGSEGTGRVEVTSTLQGILNQNASVSRGAAAVFPEQTDFGDIEVSFQN